MIIVNLNKTSISWWIELLKSNNISISLVFKANLIIVVSLLQKVLSWECLILWRTQILIMAFVCYWANFIIGAQSMSTLMNWGTPWSNTSIIGAKSKSCNCYKNSHPIYQWKFFLRFKQLSEYFFCLRIIN